MTPRLLLVDTVDQLPGLLPWHAFQALRTCDLILLRDDTHPLAPHLDMADERYETVPADVGQQAVGRTELLGGLSLVDKARASWVIGRVKAAGSCGYVFGPDDNDAFTKTLGLEAAREGMEVEVVYFGLAPPGVKLLDLVDVQQRLLAPGGCPWDAEQSHDSLIKYAVEEVHELAEAVAAEDSVAIAEELGDLLLQVVFHAQLSDAFDIDIVAQGITDKLIRRHPHVFADAQADTASDVQRSWDQIKAQEKPERTGPFDGIPSGLPAMALAAKVLARSGVDADEVAAAAEHVAEQLEDVLDMEGTADLAPALGELLLAAINLTRAAELDPEDVLRRAVQRFRQSLTDSS